MLNFIILRYTDLEKTLFKSIPLLEKYYKTLLFWHPVFFYIVITIRTENAEMSEIVWKKLYKISKIIENLKSDGPKSNTYN
jgi:hypothetical protein